MNNRMHIPGYRSGRLSALGGSPLSKRTVRFGFILLVGILLLAGREGLRAQDSSDALNAVIDTVISNVPDSAADSYEVRYDSSDITVRSIPSDDVAGYSNDPDFDYASVYTPPSSFVERVLQAIGDFFGGMIAPIIESPTGATILQYGTIAVAFLLVLWILMRSEFRGVLSRRNVSSTGIDFDEVEEDLHAMNFDLLISEALKLGNHRRAVRLHYLKLLRTMTERGLIEWRREKTNSEYLYELSNRTMRPQFAKLTRVFDYVWYGGFEIDRGQYDRIRSDFDGFAQSVEGARV